MRIEFLADHPQHALALARWHHREWGELMPDWSREDAERELTGHATRRDIPTTLILLDGEALVGSVSVLDEDASELREYSPWLASLFVAPPARGRGLGAQLVAAAVELARAQGVPRLYLFTPGHEAFYARLGWTTLDASRHVGGRPVSLMAVELAPAVDHP